MNYEIFEADSARELEDKVAEGVRINDLKPLGGVAISIREIDNPNVSYPTKETAITVVVYSQAMVPKSWG